MEIRTAEITIIHERVIRLAELQPFLDEIYQQTPSKLGERICAEISAIVNSQNEQTISWSQIPVDLATPTVIDKLIFHELGKTVSFDRKEVLFGELKLLDRLDKKELESSYSTYDFWKDWQAQRLSEDEYWACEKSYGPPEWAIGTGIALVRKGEIIHYHQLDCSF